MPERLPLLSASEIADLDEVVNVHQFNDQAVRHTKSLGDVLGLDSIGVHLVRLEPGADSTQFHFHHVDEEFLYIVSGQGIAEIGDQQYRVGAGDFMGFKRHSLAHNLHNDGEGDLVYLMGGNRSEFDICDYPRLNRRMYREQGKRTWVDLDQLIDVIKK